ncbi:uncharacterized protein PHACADRAFT_180814 [Phanerochaete carnosa HHB-10118-sp]|uniref:DUF726-domain-containing protein n=1 Tax=Phanerochaete carnosa (strain HHB-10118-sp) TaxID=650164 RepID=K5WR74_PHACS|nr:uncharacterized protein PHACADRAFT_180814 [Phanerochaete carnosa HHB-10118-sp]EKM61759.1 hypothetical protein PHACADRAFT_180814 [Phanerochaete carnosa HHB-10118-sp]
MATAMKIAPIEPSVFDDDDDGWQDMPIIRGDDIANGLDEEDQRKYHYKPPENKDTGKISNATGNVLDVDYRGDEWRAKVDQNENEYTRLRLNEEDESDEVHLRTRYLFDEDKAMTPLSQMQATKDLLTEAQRIAYVGLCALAAQEMVDKLKAVNAKELAPAIKSMELWSLKIMGRLYYHMELATEEQKMIDILAKHGIQAKDLVPALMTTHTVANPEYDPVEARRQAEIREHEAAEQADRDSEDVSDFPEPSTTPTPDSVTAPEPAPKPVQTTTRVLEDSAAVSIPGVSKHLSAADENVTLDIRWTVLCDLFLIVVADSMYDARSRVLLESVALRLGLGWLDVVKFERRVTEALDIQEEIDSLEAKEKVEAVKQKSRKRRYMMMGLATLGGGLVIGLSAGLLAPVIGAGLGAAFATVGITGTTGFLAGAGGAAVITTGGVLTGSSIAARGMARRTQYVRTFDILPLHNNKRVNCILTVPGFMSGSQDDPRLPFSVLDPVVGDVFSVLWEPEMIRETGSALKILTSEVLTQIGQTVLQATVMTALMSALQWPIILTKLGYLIDNPWSNALDRAKSAGRVLADVLMNRQLGVRPITLIGFSLGARVIFYALLELAKQKAFGIVQDVFVLGATITAPTKTWIQARSVVSGRFVNGYARSDWVLNYLFRATSGGLNTVAGLRPVVNVPGMENVDVTDKIAGHMSYRTFMPLILDQLGFPVSADYFDEPVEPDFEEDRIVVREEDEPKKRGWFTKKKQPSITGRPVSRPPSATSFPSHHRRTSSQSTFDDDLPPREPSHPTIVPSATPAPSTPAAGTPMSEEPHADPATPNETHLPKTAGFNLAAIKKVVGNAEHHPEELKMPAPGHFHVPPIFPPTHRTESAPPPILEEPALPSPPASRSPSSSHGAPVAGPSSSRTDLSSTLSRSLSLNSLRGQMDGEDNLTSSDAKTPLTTQPFRAPPPPSLTFSSGDGSFWSAEPDRATPLGGNDFSSSGRDSLSTSRPTAFGSFNSLSRPEFPSPESSGLSFEGADGSITFMRSPPLRTEPPDPWNTSSPSFGGYGSRKESSSLNVHNPWQS